MKTCPTARTNGRMIVQIADLPMAVCIVTNAVELEISVAESSLGSLSRKLFALCELDSVRGGLHAVVAQLASIGDGIQEIRRHGWLATRELNGHLTARLYLHGVIHDLHDFFPRQFVDVTNLIRIHETGIAHHIATVRQINRQDGSTAMANRATSVIVQVFVGMRRNIAAGEILFNPL